jgi:hypothetical protein
MCEPLMHIFSTQNKQDVLFEKLPSRDISLEGTMHLEIIQVAIMRLNSLFPLVINKTFYFVHIAMSYALKCTSNLEVRRLLLRIRGHRFSFRLQSHQP